MFGALFLFISLFSLSHVLCSLMFSAQYLTLALSAQCLTFSSQLCCGSSSFAFIYVSLFLSALALM